MITKVVGVTFSNEDGSSRARIIAGMTESDKVCLERDPYNQYDANAVKVCVLKNGEKKQIGFLSKDIAADVSSKLRRNVNFEVTIQGVGIWNDRPFCEIEIRESAPAQTAPEPTTSSTHVAAGPTFTPNKPASAPSKPSPTFTPNKPASAPSKPSPTFTPNKATSTQSAPSPTFTPNKPAPTPSSHTSHTESNVNRTLSASSHSPQQSKSQSSNSGCMGVFVLIAIVISALLTL
jgi:hypothetical protein